MTLAMFALAYLSVLRARANARAGDPGDPGRKGGLVP